jgi:hypothetical protein
MCFKTILDLNAVKSAHLHDELVWKLQPWNQLVACMFKTWFIFYYLFSFIFYILLFLDW